MTVKPHTADIVVKDMGAALAFYRVLGLVVPDGQEDEMQVEAAQPNGFALGFLTEAAMAGSPLGWTPPVGQRVSLAFSCDTPAEVDAVHASVTAAGHTAVTPPWDTPWGQRYASLRDPDGNRVDLFASLG